MTCVICGDPNIRARHRCITCHQYLRRRGHDRPAALIQRQTERDVERELIRELERRWRR